MTDPSCQWIHHFHHDITLFNLPCAKFSRLKQHAPAMLDAVSFAQWSSQLLAHVFGSVLCISFNTNSFLSSPCINVIIIIIILGATFPYITYAQCKLHLPTSQQARIIGGLPADPKALDNIVTIAYDTEQNNRDYKCAGSLVAPDWILTAAQCFVLPGRDYVLYGGGHSLAGKPRRIARFITHPSWNSPSTSGTDNGNPDGMGTPPTRGDIGLLQLDDPIGPLSSAEGELNLMRLNTNDKFAIPPANDRFLRFKGFGITSPPIGNNEPLQGVPRQLKFADLRTTPCGDAYADDTRRRLCTSASDKCTPCYGDIGGPLYDVDASATVNVLVGVLSIDPVASTNTSACALTDPVIYTAIAPYISWMLSIIPNNTLKLQALPADGISDVDLSPSPAPFPTIARTSIIVVSALVLIAVLAALIVTTVLRRVREQRRRWKDGLLSENSFIDPGAAYAAVEDPFQGIAAHAQKKRPTIGGMLIAITKMFKLIPFSASSSEPSRNIPNSLHQRQPIEGAPSWLNTAWERLFRPPSRSNSNSSVKNRAGYGARTSVHDSVAAAGLRVEREDAELEVTWRNFDVHPQSAPIARISVYENSNGSDSELLKPDLTGGNLNSMTHFPGLFPKCKWPVSEKSTITKRVPLSISKSGPKDPDFEPQEDPLDVTLVHTEEPMHSEFTFEGALVPHEAGRGTITDKDTEHDSALLPRADLSSSLSRSRQIDPPEDYTLSSDSDSDHEIPPKDMGLHTTGDTAAMTAVSFEKEVTRPPDHDAASRLIHDVFSARVNMDASIDTEMHEKANKHKNKSLGVTEISSKVNSETTNPLNRSKENTSVSESLKVRFPAFQPKTTSKSSKAFEKVEARRVNCYERGLDLDSETYFPQKDSNRPDSAVSFKEPDSAFQITGNARTGRPYNASTKTDRCKPRSITFSEKTMQRNNSVPDTKISRLGADISSLKEDERKEPVLSVSFEKEIDSNNISAQGKPMGQSKRIDRLQRRAVDTDSLSTPVVLPEDRITEYDKPLCYTNTSALPPAGPVEASISTAAIKEAWRIRSQTRSRNN